MVFLQKVKKNLNLEKKIFFQENIFIRLKVMR